MLEIKYRSLGLALKQWAFKQHWEQLYGVFFASV
jgi:hypothetical protein